MFRRPLVRHTHISREGTMRDPLAGVSGIGLLEHLIDLLERQALSLRNEEVGIHEAGGAEGAPDEEDLGAEVGFVGADHVGGDDCDDLFYRGILISGNVGGSREM